MPKRKRENCTESCYCFFQRKEVAAAYRIGPQRYTRKGELIANRELALDLLTLPKCRIGKKWRLGEPKVSALVSKMAETPIPRELWEEAEVTRENGSRKQIRGWKSRRAVLRGTDRGFFRKKWRGWKRSGEKKGIRSGAPIWTLLRIVV